MKKNGRKMAAPIIVTVIMIAYYAVFGVVVWKLSPSAAVCVLGIVIPLALAGVIVGVCIQRIKEIRSGEEDDLSKY
ncbi:hypothetical protein [Bariatricus massiliensis]|uniref:Uncharacterized protein n=1 Tax=Bariatricus massiliensis TaxID=1745713 RepID=A0ABS8DEE3_9FIRM|nr:hypothetical protein [Bariatricus massiliensis]MCB7302882.1 hypothetical protein [Bariatricus massiliensis]MCB7374098.1 hypothetical protein [Bariatricus massiliensis]MCB7386768.1 hypothetical protein [Bariatricus massiliensis]MCB7410930.1 hypothetical protein [Bariatricus massiliensis]